MDFGGLKVLMFSTDRNILKGESVVSSRMKEYGQLVEELHIVVLSDSSHNLSPSTLGKNIWIYPTQSLFKFTRVYSAARLGKKIVRERKFVRGKAVITAQDPFECGLAALTVKNRWRLPLEIQLHTDPFSPYFGGVLNKIRRRIAKKVFPQADSIRAVTQEMKEKVIKSFNISEEKISVLPIFIDKDKILNEKTDINLHLRYGWKYIILCVGRLTTEKNFASAIGILARLKTYLPETGLIFIGTGPEESALRNLAKKLGVEQSIAFLGWQEDTAPFYKGADIFLQTSFFEGYGMALLEAGLCSLPVVTTSVGVAKELKNGIEAVVAEGNDEEHIFKAIYDLLKNKEERERMGRNLKEKLEKSLLSEEKYMAKIKDNWEKTALKIS